MNGLPRSIALQHEAARPPWIIRVIFNQYGLSQSLDDITYPDQPGYVKWSKYMSEQQGILNAHVETLTKAYNELARLLDEG